MLAEIVAVGAVPFVRLLDQHGSGQAPQKRLGWRRYPDVVRRLISLLTRSSGLVDQVCLQCSGGNPVNAS